MKRVSRSIALSRPMVAAALVRACMALFIALFLPTTAHAQLQANTSFSPANIAPASTTTLRIQVLNNTITPATALSITDNLPTSPSGLSIAPSGVISNSCGGTLVATPGSTTITLTGGLVPASVAGVPGQCLVEVAVVAAPSPPPATYVNTIPAANITSSAGTASAPASATLTVLSANPITGSMTVSAPNIHGNGAPVRVRLQLNNSNGYALTGMAFTNALPSALQFAPTPNVVSSCGGTVTAPANGTSWSLSGGTIAASSNCVIEVNIVTRNPDTIPADSNASISLATNSITTAQGARNSATITRSIRVQKGAAVTKVFGPAAIMAGQSSTLTITLINYNATAITGFSITDAMPTGVTVTGGVTTNCGGTASFTATSVTLTGGTLAGAPSGIATASCQITATVTATTNGNYVNSIPAGNLAGVTYNAASGTLLVSSVSGSKIFTPASIPQSGTTTLVITLTNRSTASAAAITSFADNLNTMGAGFTIATTPAATTTCGGTLTATAGTTLIQLAGGAIPIAPNSTTPGSCTITVPVLVSATAPTGNRTNTIAIGALRTSLGNNLTTITARLAVSAPLTVAKSFAPATVVTGGVTRLTITLARTALAGLMTNVAVTDPLPSGFVVAAAPNATTTCTGGTISAASGATSVSLSGASLGTTIASSASCTISVNIMAPGTTGTYTNTIPAGNATATTNAGTVSNITAATRTIDVVTGISINKSFSPISIIPGGISRLTIFITNPASLAVALSSVALTDTLPVGLVVAPTPNATFAATVGTCTGTISATPGAGTTGISAAAISSGASCEFSVDVTTTAVGALTNTIPIGALTSAQGQTNVNAATATLISSGNADVTVTKTNGVTTITAGTTTTYTITITNQSSALTVAGLPVTDDEPTDMSFTAWTCVAGSGSSCAAATGTGPIASAVTLAPLGTATFSVSALLDPATEATSVTNSVTVDPAAAGVTDPVGTNNSAIDTDTIVTSADMQITKVASTMMVQIGDTITFTVTATNAGPSTARDVDVADALPSGYTLVSATPSTGTYAAPAWSLADVAPGTSAQLIMVATVEPTGDYANTATVTATTTDPDSANNSATVTPATVGLRIAKTSDVVSDPVNGAMGAFMIPGAVVEYQLVIRNEGTASIDLDSLAVDDILPPNVAMQVSAGASPAITFTDGAPSSGLTYTWPGDVEWTDNPGGIGPFDYTPSPDIDGFDPLVTGMRINPTGTMAAGTLASPAGFTLTYRVRVN